jgi:hypothetical protein
MNPEMKDANLQAYSDIENIKAFSTRLELEDYRNNRLNRYDMVVEVIKKISQHSFPLSVTKIGSGSSALLYSMLSKGVLTKGIGVELSTSRH